MASIGLTLAGAALAAVMQPATAPVAPPTRDEVAATVDKMFVAISARQLDQAARLLAPVEPHLEAWQAATPKARCASDTDMAIMSALLSSAGKVPVSVTASTPNWCRPMFARAFLAVERKDYAAALADLDRLVVHDPHSGQYAHERGHVLSQLRRFGEARAVFNATIAKRKASKDEGDRQWVAAAYRGMGWILIEEGKLGEAEAAYRASLKLEPDSRVAKAELDYISQQRKAGR